MSVKPLKIVCQMLAGVCGFFVQCERGIFVVVLCLFVVKRIEVS